MPEPTHSTLIFAMNAIAIIPLAGLLAHATEAVASRMGDTWASLLNVTFGNAVELIIFIIALIKDEIAIVQASILGSILAVREHETLRRLDKLTVKLESLAHPWHGLLVWRSSLSGADLQFDRHPDECLSAQSCRHESAPADCLSRLILRRQFRG
jgi:hypothetical protein